MAKLSDFLTVGEAAEHLGVSRDSLRRWDRAGTLRARRHPITRFRLYLKSDLDDFINGLLDQKPVDGQPGNGQRARPRRRRRGS